MQSIRLWDKEAWIVTPGTKSPVTVCFTQLSDFAVGHIWDGCNCLPSKPISWSFLRAVLEIICPMRFGGLKGLTLQKDSDPWTQELQQPLNVSLSVCPTTEGHYWDVAPRVVFCCIFILYFNDIIMPFYDKKNLFYILKPLFPFIREKNNRNKTYLWT